MKLDVKRIKRQQECSEKRLRWRLGHQDVKKELCGGGLGL